VAALLLLAGPVSAEPAQPASAPTVLHLTQPAERRLPRDRLHVEIRAEKTGADPRAVQAAINAAMAAGLAAARQMAGIEIQTGSYAVYRTAPQNPPEWVGMQSLSLTGGDAGALLDLAGRLQSQGLVMSNLGYEVSPQALHEAEDELTAEALAALERRAAAIAQQLRLSVLGYRDLTVGNAQAESGPRAMMAAAGAAAMPAPVAAPGEASVRLAVSADILLGPPRP
jgi:predicted secreted protein